MRYNLKVYLVVNNPYSNADTLTFVRPDNLEQVKIPGPFLSGLLATFSHQYILNAVYPKNYAHFSYYLKYGYPQNIEFELDKLCNKTVVLNVFIN